MARISIESNLAGPPLLDLGEQGEGRDDLALGGHLYLVYTNDSGQEFVIRGGPARSSNPLDFGPLVMEVGVPIANSVDARVDPTSGKPLTPADRGSRDLDLGGRSATDVWNVILQHANSINNAVLPYLLFTRNSNSLLTELLALVDIDLSRNLPTAQFQTIGPAFPGITTSGFRLDNRIDGTSGNDRIIGREGNQTFNGAGGNDYLDGGGGHDTLTGGCGCDTLVASSGIDRLTGGRQADRFRFSSLPSFGASVADRLTDFAAAEGDRVELSRSAFGIAAGAAVTLAKASSAIGLALALRTTNLFVYDTRFGHLYWNRNSSLGGAGGGGGVFAVLDPQAGSAPILNAADISLI